MYGLELRQRPPGYELFFAPLAVVMEPNDYERIQFAYFASKYGHAKQTREDGTRYFDHPKSAAWIYINELGGRDPRVITNLLLHDIQEDTYLLSSYRVSLNFGVDIALDVRALTKLPKGKEALEAYLRRNIARGPWAIISKLCDRLHNLRTLAHCAETKRLKQIAETEELFIPLLIPALRSSGEEWANLADKIETMLIEAIDFLEQK